MSFVRSYVVPEGFPHSVTPSYVPYMTWRALKVCIFVVYELLDDGGLLWNLNEPKSERENRICSIHFP